MKPEQISEYVERMAGKHNSTGSEAYSRKKRFGLEKFGDPNVFDCDDRAEIARQLAVKNGYSASTRVQQMRAGQLAHRYLVVNSNGKDYDVLKKLDVDNG
jgi:hypothetical protein